MSLRKFKSLCVQHGLNPVIATQYHQLRLAGKELSTEEFSLLWEAFIKRFPSWNTVVQLAGKLGITI